MTIDVTLGRINDLTNTNTAQQTLNSNNDAVTEAFLTALNDTGDQMDGTLDMNSNRIINLPAPSSASEPARLADVTSTSISLSLPSLTGVVTGTSGTGAIVTTFSGAGNLPVSQLGGGSGASASTFLRGDGTWQTPGSATITAGVNIAVSGTNPASISIATISTNYTLIQGATTASGGASILIGNVVDPTMYLTGNYIFKNTQTGTGVTITNGSVILGVTGATAGSVTISPSVGTGAPTLAAATASSTSYTLRLPTSLGSMGAVYVSGGATSPTTWAGVSTTSNQIFMSVSAGVPLFSTSVWPIDVTTTNQILVCSASHTWSASQTVTNLTLTTPTLTTATMTGTTLLANATMSGSLTFANGTVGVVGCTDTSSGAAGQVGEYLSTTISLVSAQSLFSNSASGIMSLSLPPGDWDIVANGNFTFTGATCTVQQMIASINSTANAFNPAPGFWGGFSLPSGSSFSSANGTFIGGFWVGPTRISLAATATYFNVALCNFVGSMSGWGLMRARRVR